jgi:hypothetical protein
LIRVSSSTTGVERVVDAVERAMDDAGFATAHLAGNSLVPLETAELILGMTR